MLSINCMCNKEDVTVGFSLGAPARDLSSQLASKTERPRFDFNTGQKLTSPIDGLITPVSCEG